MTVVLFPERMEIQILADGRPLPGALVDVSLSMTSKNPHTMVLGPADEAGRIVATREELLERASENCRNFVMDYADPATYFGGTVDIKPVTPARLKEMRAAHAAFVPHFKYREKWASMLIEVEKWFGSHPVSALEARATVVPSEVRLSLLKAQL